MTEMNILKSILIKIEYIIAFLILIKWYDLKDEKKEELFAVLKEKGLK